MSEPATKYGNIKTVVDGIKFDSKKEATFYGRLKMMKRSYMVSRFELQPVFEYEVHYSANGRTFKQKRKYIADFKVFYPDGRVEIWDVKGCKTAIYKQKKKIVENLYQVKIIEK